MLSAVLVTETRGCRALLQRAPRGTPSSVLALRLCRCFHRQKPNAYRPVRYARNVNAITGLRYATTYCPPSLLSQNAVTHVQSLLAPSEAEISHNAIPLSQPHDFNADGTGILAADAHGPRVEPLQRALSSLREGDTRRLLIRLKDLDHMRREELQEAVAALPRTTFTEFFRALDPLRVLRHCDQVYRSYVPPGMAKKLFMNPTIDDWGVRKVYTRLLQRLLILMSALQIAGYTLHMEEYITLFRSAGACGDKSGAKAIWNDMTSGPALAWRNSEVYTEFMKARFLTEPLYTNYEKTRRMVTPRDLHRSHLRFTNTTVRRLDGLRLLLRKKRGLWGLNKDVEHVEELMRALRGSRPAVKLFQTVTATHSFRLDESLLCTVMIALGRSGSMGLIGTEILQRYFGIRTPHPFPLEDGQEVRKLELGSDPPRIRPTVRLMRAVVETYGSNAEIAVAVQLVEHLSNTYNIPIPQDVWQDLLEWTFIMSTPPACTAWEIANLHAKIPSPQAVEMVWNAMIAPPYNQAPSFQSYSLLIRCLINLYSDDLTPVLSRMREAIALYDEHCKVYEATALKYLQHLRGGISSSAMIQRFERARFKKQRMWYDISVWCRMILKSIPFSKTSPVPNSIIPDFVREFRPFLRNPVEYLTPTGRVSLVDPLIETFGIMKADTMQLTVRMRNMQGNWKHQRLRVPRAVVLSSQSLAKFKTFRTRSPMDLLAPTKDSFVFNSIYPRPEPRDFD
ncbi:mitochondrial ATPase expression-domain-containing protein [Nemania abortiva]|nr:mitochondrial ATPase expression-domain-containing protein [Nemania abortiva]